MEVARAPAGHSGFRVALQSLACALLMSLFFTLGQTGFLLLFVAVPLILWLVYSCYVAVTDPKRRGIQLTKVVIWIAACSFAVGYQAHMHVTTRHKANKIAEALNRYVKETGRCLQSLDSIGFTRARLRRELGSAYYSCEDGKMDFFYVSTYVPFHTEQYDFKQKTWRHLYD